MTFITMSSKGPGHKCPTEYISTHTHTHTRTHRPLRDNMKERDLWRPKKHQHCLNAFELKKKKL